MERFNGQAGEVPRVSAKKYQEMTDMGCQRMPYFLNPQSFVHRVKYFYENEVIAPTLLRWKEGQTGDQLVDANMRELKATGFMSNRGRQNVVTWTLSNTAPQSKGYLMNWFRVGRLDVNRLSYWSANHVDQNY